MAYQNVGTPRFYVNVVEWLMANKYLDLALQSNVPQYGVNEYTVEVYRTLPVKQVEVTSNYAIPRDLGTYLSSPIIGMTKQSFIAILGHSLPTYGEIGNYHVLYDSTGSTNIGGYVPVVNCFNHSAGIAAEYNGFSIATFDMEHDYLTGFAFNGNTYAGSVIIGTYYDMPHSPELELTMTREMDGVNILRTKGGHDFIDKRYTKPPLWGGYYDYETGISFDGGAWELIPEGATPTNQALSRPGRRIWNLSFNYLDDGDVFGPNQLLLNESFTGSPHYYPFYDNESDLDGDDFQGGNQGYKSNLLNDDNFYSQVIHKTNGGQLPFIFQPDNNNNNEFAIAKLDMKSFKFKQVANGVYDLKLKIREVW